MNLISQIIVYPSSLTNFRLDCRFPFGRPFMLMAFNYISEPETDERVIRKMENTFDIAYDDMAIKPISVRQYLTTSHEETTYFKEKISLS